MLSDLGPRPIELNGKKYLCYLLTPVGFGAVTAKVQESLSTACQDLLAYIDKLPPALAEKAWIKAMELDDENKRIGMDDAQATMRAFFKPEILGEVLFFMAKKMHPEITLEKMIEEVTLQTPTVALAHLIIAFPEMLEKKEGASSPLSWNGTPSIGGNTVPKSRNKRTTHSVPKT